MPIHDGTHMLVPLFHGTSKIFLSSIQSGGLGTTNPNDALNTFGLLADLVHIIERNQPDDSTPEMYGAQLMLNQKVTTDANFRHGNVYLHASKRRAVSHALSYSHGSELLTQVFTLYEMLENIDKIIARDISDKYPAIFELRGAANQPLVVEVRQVPIESLRTEKGDNPTDLLKMMQDKQHTGNDFWAVLGVFELTTPLGPGNLGYYDVESTNSNFVLKRYQSPHVLQGATSK